MSKFVEATDDYLITKLEVVIAEATSGFVGAIPEQDDRDMAVDILKLIEAKIQGGH